MKLRSTRVLTLVMTVLVSLLVFGGMCYAEDGLVARYTFNGNFNDSSGNMHNGTVIGNVTLADDDTVGKCAAFTGGYLDVASTPALNMGSNYTISAWVLVDPVQGKGNKTLPIVAKLDDKALYNVYHAYARGTFSARMDLKFLKNVGSSVFGAAFDNYATDTKWTHLVFSFDGQRIFLYVNGNMKGVHELKTPDSVVPSNGKLRIGTGNDLNNKSLFFMGKMADVRLYNRALSAGEIQALTSAGASYQELQPRQ